MEMAQTHGRAARLKRGHIRSENSGVVATEEVPLAGYPSTYDIRPSV
jgi:hypothetical protein